MPARNSTSSHRTISLRWTSSIREGGPQRWSWPIFSASPVRSAFSISAVGLALERAGFHVSAWEDTTAKALAAAVERSQTVVSPSALGLHLIFGMDWPQISANILRNYQERKIGIIQGVAVPAALAHP